MLKLVSADNDNIATFESGAPGTTKAVATVGERKAEVTITVGSGT